MRKRLPPRATRGQLFGMIWHVHMHSLVLFDLEVRVAEELREAVVFKHRLSGLAAPSLQQPYCVHITKKSEYRSRLDEVCQSVRSKL